jgi:hypothetical protein
MTWKRSRPHAAGESRFMNGFVLIGILVLYIALNFFILPKLGVPT